MLAGTGMAAAASFHGVCRFFSHHAWDSDRVGLTLARLIVSRLLGVDAAIEVVVDDTLFSRWGPKVFGAFWTHDGSAQASTAIGRGNRWIIAGIVITLRFSSHPVCLPVLFRLWRGKGTHSPVRLAGALISVLAQAFPDRRIHVVGDAAYHGKPLLVTGATITTRLPANAALYAPAPPRTGRRGRPRLKGDRLGRPADLAASAEWRKVTVARYGRADIVEVAATPSIWHGAFGNAEGRTVSVREVGDDKTLAVFTTDTDTTIEDIAARNRLPRAVERTVPFQFVVYSLVIAWYALHGHHPDDLTDRRTAQPWYRHKHEPAVEDMLAKLRRTVVAAQITGVATARPDPHKYRDYELACAATAA